MSLDQHWGDWRFMFPRKRQAPELPDHYYECRLLPDHRDWLLELLDGGDVKDDLRGEVMARVKNAPRYDVPPAEVDWQAYEKRAEERGESLVDLIYDNPKGAT